MFETTSSSYRIKVDCWITDAACFLLVPFFAYFLTMKVEALLSRPHGTSPEMLLFVVTDVRTEIQRTENKITYVVRTLILVRALKRGRLRAPTFPRYTPPPLACFHIPKHTSLTNIIFSMKIMFRRNS
jgi:hypothetical protein